MADSTTLDPIALDRVAARFGVECPTDHVEIGEVVETILLFRQDARRSKDFALADEIRDALGKVGVEVKDAQGGSEWSVHG